jgi:hypothetical protein
MAVASSGMFTSSIFRGRLNVCYATFVVDGAEENNLMSDKPAKQGGSPEMTGNERELVAALEADIATWESEVQFFERFVNQVEMMGIGGLPGRDYAGRLRERIAEHRTLIAKVKNG